ncbi:protein ACCELERATED CELL DEATH 6-like [Rhodamnia argentea]|uniref:Protein ACCELERATED CELL DEATH 6-like n=1 Tax=Rhodamnia argentea TaxID=178133 RepID=A0ABM3H3D0_9MYRT|nr:protein ACCELERATED CELL DEATH 6-like [Rhodamnia argentea]
MKPAIPEEEESKMDEDVKPPVMAKKCMDSSMYKAAREGNFPYLENSIRLKHGGNTDEEEALLLETHNRNNLVHLAVESGHKDFIQQVLHKCPKLAAKRNSRGDTPLHVVAQTGCYHIAEAILSMAEPHEGTAGTDNSLLRLKNNGGNTALHEALRNGDKKMGMYLWEDKETVGSVNESGESALYVGAALGVESVVKKMVEYLRHGGGARVWDGPLRGPDGQNPLHAAVLAGSIGCVEALICFDGTNMINKPDDSNGRTPLHFAAKVKAKDIVAHLLQTDPSSAYVKDVNGRTPLLEAASLGHLSVLREILKHCPDTVEISNEEGRNAAHFALKCELSRSKAVLKEPEVVRLVNEADRGGNTPLHVAAEDLNYRMVKRLLKMPEVDLRAKNKAGRTFLDICESRWQYTKKQEFLYRYLKSLPPGRKPHSWNHSDNPPTRLDKPDADLKGHANALSIVAALLATVTFAAAFTLPGGLTPDDNNIGAPVPQPSPLCNFHDSPDCQLKPGHPILIHQPAFKVFIIADVLASSTSLTVLFILIAAMLADDTALRRAIVYSKNLLYLSLGGTLVAFMTGLVSVISTDVKWLGYAVWVIGLSVPFLIKYFEFKSFTSTPVFLHRHLSMESWKKPRSFSRSEKSGNETESFDDKRNWSESVGIYLGPLTNRFSSRRSCTDDQKACALDSEQTYKQNCQTLLMVATLITTMTFAAAFTMPGAYNNNAGPGQGMALLQSSSHLKWFIISDTIAMTCSTMAASLILWGSAFGKRPVVHCYVIAAVLTCIALQSTAISFVTGLVAVLPDQTYVRTVSCVVGSVFHVNTSLFLFRLAQIFSFSEICLSVISHLRRLKCIINSHGANG